MQSHKKAWEEFRQTVIELDGGKCVRCHRSRDQDRVVLQVHHKQYIRGRAPWDYPTELCETLCRGCHAEEHGKKPPASGWECTGFHDLESLDGKCELCGTDIRYVFLVSIEGWPTMEVGEICCDNLTSSEMASNHLDSVKRYESRRRTFVASKRWKAIKDDVHELTQNSICIQITPSVAGLIINANGIPGRQIFPSLATAKSKCFELLETGQLREFLDRAGKLAA